MNAGPFPPKEMFEPIRQTTLESSGYVELGAYPWARLVPAFGLGSGEEIRIEETSGDQTAAPAPIKTLEFEWKGVNTCFFGLSLNDLAGSPLLLEDIESIEILPFSANDPYPFAGNLYLNRMVIGSLMEGNLPEWGLGLMPLHGAYERWLLFGEKYSGVQAASGRVKITFTGNGTTKLRMSNTTSASHPTVRTVARDAGGNVLNVKIAFTTLMKRSSQPLFHGVLPQQSFPIVAAPTPITEGGIAGMEIVWPEAGTPYLHVFKQGSNGGSGQHFHVPLTAGLP